MKKINNSKCIDECDRGRKIELWSSVAQHCLLVGNYNSATSILEPICRLQAMVSETFRFLLSHLGVGFVDFNLLLEHKKVFIFIAISPLISSSYFLLIKLKFIFVFHCSTSKLLIHYFCECGTKLD